jgi:hypothetical protein
LSARPMVIDDRKYRLPAQTAAEGEPWLHLPGVLSVQRKVIDAGVRQRRKTLRQRTHVSCQKIRQSRSGHRAADGEAGRDPGKASLNGPCFRDAAAETKLMLCPRHAHIIGKLIELISVIVLRGTQ